MINAIIVDDEENNILNLSGLLQKHCKEVKVLATARSAAEAIEVLNTCSPHLVFLDIEMPGGNGFELIQSLKKADFEIIFVTAFSQYAIQAIKLSALDYLLKPIDVAGLKNAVTKAIEKLEQRKQNLRLQNLVQLLGKNGVKEDHRIALASAKEIRFVKTGDIIRCESSNNYTKFYLAGGSSLLVSKPIYEYEELLADYGFVRCHQSHLVNTMHIVSWLKSDGDSLLMKDNFHVPISRQQKEAIKQVLQLKQ